MPPDTKDSNDATELLIAGKELRRTTYTALALFAAVGMVVMLFQHELEQLLGGLLLNIVILTLAALILIAGSMNLIRLAARRIDLRVSQLQVATSMTVKLGEQAALMVDNHLLLDEAIGVQLKGVIGDTENAAIMIIIAARNLNDAANTLVSYVDNSNMKVDDMEHEIGESLAFITQIGNVVQGLPDRLQQDLEIIRKVAKEIDKLADLVDVIKEINKQIDSLAFNVSLEPETLGEFESGFANVSDEVRKLSKRASQAAVTIEQGLTTVQYLLQNELKFNLQKESVQQMSNTGKIVESVRTLQESRDYMRQYYKTLFSLVTTHNTRVTKEIAEILGQIQFQDVARQRIERMENAMAKRNVLFQAFARELDAPDANLLELPVQMREVLDEYMSIESCHAPASNNTSGQDADLFKHELF